MSFLTGHLGLSCDAASARSLSRSRSRTGPAKQQSLWENLEPEDDDYLHDPDLDDDRRGRRFPGVSKRGIASVSTLVVMTLSVFAVFLQPSVELTKHRVHQSNPFTLVRNSGNVNLDLANGTGQIADLPDLLRLIDPQTPSQAHSWMKPVSERSSFHLVFSDKFETDGRTFWPGDDPTGDYEWYSPEAVNTSGGFLNIALEEHPLHGRNFRSGMLQSWNKLCLQGGYVEVSVILPGSMSTGGLWPGIWMMGNLGRPGYLGTSHGMWPYSYNSCDTGILPNQTWLNKTGPQATVGRLTRTGTALSYLTGMRTPACTCPGEDHPGPSPDVGPSAPELDIFEVWSGGGSGMAAQSAQVAPFDADYNWTRWSDVTVLHQNTTAYNDYLGGPYQQSVSGTTSLPTEAFKRNGARPTVFGLDYEPDWHEDGSGHVTWYVDGRPTWTLSGRAIGPQPYVEIGQRLVQLEPMSIFLNVAISQSWGEVQWKTIQFPATIKVDYVRVYQRDGQRDRISCDPHDHPTARYLQDHLDIYTDPNLTVYPAEVYGWPKNQLTHNCSTGQKLS